MPIFDHIAIIFNPESTGDAPEKAASLAEDIDRRFEDIGVSARLTPTERAGHAVTLAREIASRYKRPLIISVSGDGGYNEVVCGAMQAKNASKSADPVVAVVGAGNANDHRRVMRDRPLIELIIEAQPKPLDLLRIKSKSPTYELDRYAHSYIGFGVTPQVGHELNRRGKSVWNEICSILRTYRIYAPFKIKRSNQTIQLDNLVFANINEIAKFVQLDDANTPQDGMFEVLELTHRSKTHMLLTLLRAALLGFQNTPSFRTYEFTVCDDLPVQCDGEIEQVSKDSTLIVTSEQHAIDSLF